MSMTPERIEEIKKHLNEYQHEEIDPEDGEVMRIGSIYMVPSDKYYVDVTSLLDALEEAQNRLERTRDDRNYHQLRATKLSGQLYEAQQQNNELFNQVVTAKHQLRQIIGDLTPAEFVVEVVQNQDEFVRTQNELEEAHQHIQSLSTKLSNTENYLKYWGETAEEAQQTIARMQINTDSMAATIRRQQITIDKQNTEWSRMTEAFKSIIENSDDSGAVDCAKDALGEGEKTACTNKNA